MQEGQHYLVILTTTVYDFNIRMLKQPIFVYNNFMSKIKKKVLNKLNRRETHRKQVLLLNYENSLFILQISC